MPHTDNLDREQEQFANKELRRMQFFKVVVILIFFLLTIIVVGILTFAVLYSYNL
jgi:hypothetical protein